MGKKRSAFYVYGGNALNGLLRLLTSMMRRLEIGATEIDPGLAYDCVVRPFASVQRSVHASAKDAVMSVRAVRRRRSAVESGWLTPGAASLSLWLPKVVAKSQRRLNDRVFANVSSRLVDLEPKSLLSFVQNATDCHVAKKG